MGHLNTHTELNQYHLQPGGGVRGDRGVLHPITTEPPARFPLYNPNCRSLIMTAARLSRSSVLFCEVQLHSDSPQWHGRTTCCSCTQAALASGQAQIAKLRLFASNKRLLQPHEAEKSLTSHSEDDKDPGDAELLLKRETLIQTFVCSVF